MAVNSLETIEIRLAGRGSAYISIWPNCLEPLLVIIRHIKLTLQTRFRWFTKKWYILSWVFEPDNPTNFTLFCIPPPKIVIHNSKIILVFNRKPLLKASLLLGRILINRPWVWEPHVWSCVHVSVKGSRINLNPSHSAKHFQHVVQMQHLYKTAHGFPIPNHGKGNRFLAFTKWRH